MGTWLLPPDAYETVLRLKPGHAPALRQLGDVRTQQEQFDVAAVLLRESIAHEPTTDAYNNLGMVLLRLKRPEEAIICFEQAITIQPRYAFAHNNLGIALALLGRHDQAAKHYKAALEVDPNYVKALNNLGTLYRQTNRAEESISLF